MGKKLTFGSVCSGIEASQLAFNPFGFEQLWSSEIAEFPSKVLEHHFPDISNVGDMINIPNLILNKDIEAPDLFCGGTPCQAFSLAGWKNGLADERGQLTMTFIEIANAIDKVRLDNGKDKSIILWENVEGVLNDKTNAFGNFIAGLAGFEEEIKVSKWTKSGYLEGNERNVAWRVIDAKYFGLPHQRKRLYVLAGGKDFKPDQILFEFDNKDIVKELKAKNTTQKTPTLFDQEVKEETNEKIFSKLGVKFEVFREYTDCLYAAYGTKWNGNAAAYNGSLYVSENNRIRRFTPLECERLMGFPDNYTKVNGNSHTNRFQAIGNSWAVPVVKWIGSQINQYMNSESNRNFTEWQKFIQPKKNKLNALLYLLNGVNQISQTTFLNSSNIPNQPKYGHLKDIVEPNHALEKFYLSAKACAGILRRKRERNMKMNSELESLMEKISGEKAETAESEKSKHTTLGISSSLSDLIQRVDTDYNSVLDRKVVG
ncbi:DNA cytosine methyltransferase [Flagellimonas okinawensis]|uniref:DNA (cytosine-5-)-methyltransferase n=1 Tax=Flagellimonas okinawensis TaxID=3031324 RepID=A0ABT5XK89_9FLAO|nr:DNA cytosine methyltransferase [[Muricauda] okinawensis]MDF0706292.1 DNA cytosine methyltransferase [[Muricauda] okinawensis]